MKSVENQSILDPGYRRIILETIRRRKRSEHLNTKAILYNALYLQEYLNNKTTLHMTITDLRDTSPQEQDSLGPSLIVIKHDDDLVTILYTTKEGVLHKKFIIESGSTDTYTCTTLMKKLKKQSTAELSKKYIDKCTFTAITPELAHSLNHRELHVLKYATLQYFKNCFDVTLNGSHADFAAKAIAKK